MLEFKNKQLFFFSERCTQCGVCLAACNFSALEVRYDRFKGLFSLIPNENCTRCGKCVAVCPARHLQGKTEPELSEQVEAWLSYSSDSKLREQASSGGAVRVLAASCLRSGLAQEAYLAVRSSDFPWARGAVVGDAEQLLAQVSNSMYLPVPAGRNLSAAQGGESIILVGLPCQVYGGTLLLRDRYKKIYTISIFCKQQKHLAASRHMARRLGKKFSEGGKPLQYRGQGWPGRFSLDGTSLPYVREGALSFGHRLWRVPGCRFCNVPFGLGVDISVGDPWGIDLAGPGRSLVMVFSEQGQAMLKAAGNALCNELLVKREALLAATGMSNIKRKYRLSCYYSGVKVPLAVTMAGLADRMQISLMEFVLNHVRLPEIGYRVMGKLPDVSTAILKLSEKFSK